jgi:LacI family transcriptional regulator
MKANRKVKLDDIAKKLGVSKVTISKALRDHPDISTETISKVRKTAEKLGYIPNYVARNLSANKTYTIGLIVPKIAHFFYAPLIETFYDAAYEKKYEIILTVSQEDPEKEKKHIETMLSMRVDGILISATNQTKDMSAFEKVIKNGTKLVMFDRVFKNIGCSTITFNDKEGSYNAVNQAISCGYSKIGFVGSNIHLHIGKERYSGYKKALQESEIPLNKKWVFPGDFNELTGYDALYKMHKSNSLPEFIFATSYPVALGILKAANELNISIPKELDLISFGDSTFNQNFNTAISTVNQSTFQLGRKAVEVILNEINSIDGVKEQHIILDTELIIRETCNKLKQS